MICPDAPTETKRSPPCGDATVTHILVAGDMPEYVPFVLMRGSGFGRENVMSSDVRPPPCAHDQLPLNAQKLLMVMPFPNTYSTTFSPYVGS